MDVRYLKGVGEATAKLLHKIGISTADDLIENIPREYVDYSNIQTIGSIKPGLVTIKATIGNITNRRSKRGLHMTEAHASDSSGSVRITWFNQPYRATSIKVNEEYFISGEFAGSYKYLTINNPTVELASEFPLHTARLVPKYKLTKGLNAHLLRKITKHAFDTALVTERLPLWMRQGYGLLPRKEALLGLHFPDAPENIIGARRTIGFEELFGMTLASELNRQEYAKLSTVSIPFKQSQVKDFVNSLPYTLTSHQRIAAWDILQDMTEGTPMNRLLEGDVGSGKTVVAAIAMVNVVANNFQCAIMAPTEILAMQHAETLYKILPNSVSDKLILLTGSMAQKQKNLAYERIESGDVSIVVGTHALVQSKVRFNALGLVIIDEQHRFGVSQRKLLQAKALHMPHVLNMTATPIPRSLMLTLYGEMDASILAEKPPGREKIATRIIKPENRQKLYASLVAQLKSGRQVYIVCPQIESSEENLQKTSRPLSVDEIAKQVSMWLKEFTVGILHGKMKSVEKERIMKQFSDGYIHILVSTTVIEVGVDIPNATAMILEGADKFGLAQIHQLRGRVGRGEYPGVCYLIPSDNETIAQRLKLVEKEMDGFRLAEYDLKLRGPGAIYGTSQHGALDLRVADISDKKLIAEARTAAREFIDKREKLVDYPELKRQVDQLRTISNLN